MRTQLFPDHHQRHRIPVRVLGLKVFLSPEEMEPIRKLDPFFLQGTSSQNDTFLYLSSEYLLLSFFSHPTLHSIPLSPLLGFWFPDDGEGR